jgi:serine/threonine-protein kinase
VFANKLVERYPSLAALELFDVLTESERLEQERRPPDAQGRVLMVREPALDSSSHMVPAKARPRHVVLTRLLPYHTELYGLDIMFEPWRQQQVRSAAHAGAPTVTAKFRLVEDPADVFSVAVYDPLYIDGMDPIEPAARERQLRGFAIALYRLAPLMSAALAGTTLDRSSLSLIDREPGLTAENALLFGTRQRPAADDLVFTQDIHFAGRRWTLSTWRRPPGLRPGLTSSLVGFVGSVLFAALVALWTSLRKSRQRFQALQELGPYTLGREIGGGGMGRVFEARHNLLRRRAAIKVIAHENATEEQLRRFDLEAKTTSELCHPNTVVVFDYGRTRRGDFYYAMEYLSGITWERLVEQYGAQPAARVRHLLVQACGSLAEAHGLGLVHRDIKPGNLMLGVSGGIFDFVKVLDFGLVRVTRGVEAGKSGPGVLLGTPRYMAPESFASSHSGPRADIYSLGCVAYFLLSGRDPFYAKTDAGIAMLHLTQMPAPLAGTGKGDLTPAFEKLVLRCLAKSPEDRFASAGQLLRALNDLDLPPWTQADAAMFWADVAAAQDAAEAAGR